MDQIRKVFSWLKQYHFWVLTVLVALVALFCWYRAAGKLSKEFASNKSTIKSGFDSLQQLQSKPFHPNQEINDKQLEEINKQRDHVKQIWDTLYARQSENVLKWPEDLSPAFREYIKTRKFGDPIPRDLRENYRDYIDRHFESLPKIVNARILEDSQSGSLGEGGFMGRGGGRGMYNEGGPAFRGDEGSDTGFVVGQDDDYLCEWLDQGLVRQELNFSTTPSAPRIWVTQENLWAYHTLLDIIAKTNEAAGADRRSNAAVRTIISLEVGQPAAAAGQSQGRVEILQAPSAGGELAMGEEGMMGAEGGMPMEGGRGEMGMGNMYPGGERGMFSGEMGGGAPMSDDQEKAMLEAGRYVDENGAPIGGMAAASAEGTDPSMAAAPAGTSGPFKRLPVRMTLEMDQRWLTHLIAECASQPLQVEVREVRLSTSSDMSMGGAGRGGMFSEGGSRGSFGAGGTGSGSTFQSPLAASGSLGDALTFKQNPNRVTVVIQGMIYIFNEPDETILQAEPGGEMAATP